MIVDCIYHKREFEKPINCLLVTCCKVIIRNVNFNYNYDELLRCGHLKDIKNHPNFPKQTNEHNALADARWNKQLYEFLNNL